MAKEPVAGAVKTRLARDIGSPAAAAWTRRRLADLARRLGRSRRWQLLWAVAPARARSSAAIPAPPGARLAQSRGDLGVRMRGAIAAARRRGHGAVLVIGTDVPGLSAAHIARALAELRRADVVFGPAPDGGYWLVGIAPGRPLPPGFLRGVRWSGPHALADSRASCGPLRVALTETLADVDGVADLRGRREWR